MSTQSADFTADEIALMGEALDSLLYWTSEPTQRSSGYVLDPTDEQADLETLIDRYQAQDAVVDPDHLEMIAEAMAIHRDRQMDPTINDADEIAAVSALADKLDALV